MADLDPNALAAELRKTGQYSEEEIAEVLADMMGDEPGTPAALQLRTPVGEAGLSATQKAAVFLGPAIGGFYGAQAAAGRNILPFLGGAGRIGTQFLGEATGIAAGDVAGRLAGGLPQDPLATARLAGGGAAAGSLIRGVTQLGGAIGSIPESATQAAAEPVRAGSVPLPIPNLQRMARAGPHAPAQVKAGISPETQLADRASAAAKKATRTITKQRQEKVAIIRQADASNIRIPIEPIKDALRDNLANEAAEKISDFRLLNNKIRQTIAMLDATAKGGTTLKPSQVDNIIRKVLRPKAYTGTGRPSNTLFAQAVSDAEQSATQLLNDFLPGDLAAKNSAISTKLTEVETATALFGDPDKAGVVNRMSNAFTRGNEVSARALNVLSEHDPRLVDDAYNLYVRRQFAGDIREAPMQGAGYFGALVRKPAELATRTVAPFQRFAGGVSAGAYNVFSDVIQRAREPRQNP